MQGERLISLDAFRGATIAAMLLVNNPGSWSHVYAPLRHAEWHGWTPTDLIFPFFLFIVGAAMAWSLRRYREAGAGVSRGFAVRVTRRVALLVGLGLLLNAFPTFDLAGVRLPGVLQRIGLVYLIAAPLVVLCSGRMLVVVGAMVLLVYWWVLGRWGMSPDENLARTIDHALFGPFHLYRSGESTDPEGLLSTLPAVVTTLLGYRAGLLIRDGGRVDRVLIESGVLAGLGLLWGVVLPINKPLWTPSYVLLSAGLAGVCFAGAYWLIDMQGRRWIGRPFEQMGVNAITAFVGSGLLARVLIHVRVGDDTLKGHAYGWLVETGLGPMNASLAFGVLTVLLWMGILWGLARAGIRLRV